MANAAVQITPPTTGTKKKGAPTLAALVPALAVMDKDSPLKTKLQPVEFFDAQKEKALDFFVLGKYVVVKRATNGGVSYQAYTEAGKLASMKFELPGGTLTANDLIVFLKSQGKVGYALKGRFNDCSELSDVVATISGAPWDTEELKALLPNKYSIGKNSNGEWLHIDNIPHSDDALFKLEYGMLIAQSSKGLVFTKGNHAIVIETMSGTGEQSPPEEWVRTEIDNMSSVNAQTLKKLPSLAACSVSQITANDYGTTLDQGVLKVVRGKEQDLVFSEQSTAFALARHDKNILSFVDSQTGELKTLLLTTTKGVDTPLDVKKLPFEGTVKAMLFDPSGNYLVCAVEKDQATTIYIIDRDTATVQAEFKKASDKIDRDDDGSIFYIDADAKLRMIQTNFCSIPKGGLAQTRTERLAELESVEANLEDLDLVLISPRRGKKASKELSAAVLLERSQQKLLERIDPAIQKATTLEEVAGVSERIESLKANKAYEKFPEIFEPVEAKIRTRIDAIRVGGFKEQLDALKGELPELDTPAELVRLDKEFARLSRERRDLVIFDPALRTEVDGLLKGIRAKVEEVHQKVQAEVSTSLNGNLDAIKTKMATVATIPELQLLQGEKECLDFSDLLSVVRDPAARQEWMAKYKGLIDEKKDLLVKEIEAEEEAERKTVALAIEEGKQILEEIKEQVDEIGSTTDFAAFKTTSPLLKKLKAKTDGLPEEYRIAEEEKLTVLLQNRERSLAARSSLGGGTTKGHEVTFGKESFPVFKAPPLVWLAKILPLHDGSPQGMLAYQSNLGHLFAAPCDPVPANLEHPDTKSALSNTKAAAEAYFDGVKRKPPAFDSNWVVNDFYRDRLDGVARICRSQIQNQRGMLILESDAGAGKNVLCDMFGHFTNREVHMFSCNFQTEKEDLTTAFKFDPKKGTYSLDAELLRKLQTPGAIICFDEINALPTGVTKLLNPMLDYRRALYLPDGRVIKLDPTVILLGTMNPQSYLGVKPLSPEVKSRARMMPVPYPPEKVGNKYAPYEAEILAKQVPCLKTLKQDEFYALWNYTVNGDTVCGGDRYTNKDRELATKRILQIVKSANRVREAYNAFRSGKSTDPVTLVFSIRETIDIASELSGGSKVKDIIKEVVLPKIGGMDERDRVEVIIDNS
jgi:hypothetical protein